MADDPSRELLENDGDQDDHPSQGGLQSTLEVILGNYDLGMIV
jgi:hypothetical protein